VKGTLHSQKGIGLVVTILMLLLAWVIGLGAVNIMVVGGKTAANHKTQNQAFYVAEGGLEAARESLRSSIAAGNTLSGLLKSAAGGVTNGLINSNSIANFPPAVSSNNVPFVSSTSFGAGSFTVYLTNDAGEAGGVTSTTDTNNLVTLTSFGYGPNNSRAVVQAVVNAVLWIPAVPAAVALQGPNVVFSTPDSDATSIAGDATHPAIAVTTDTSVTNVKNSIKSQRYGNYTGHGLIPSVENVNPLPTSWNNVSGIQSIYTLARNNADFTSPGQPGFTLGTTSNRKTVVINGDYSLNGSGAGVLVVTGRLTLHGEFSYDGLILVIGNGYLIRDGGGGGNINGGILAANICGPDGIINTPDDVMANPTMNMNGGGNSTITYDPNSQLQSLNGFSASASRTSWNSLLN
jgi:Tfp pilus assembly protein PilX